MKIGFLLNIVLLLCFICSQVLIWLLDGTLVNSLVQLLDKQSTVFRRAGASTDTKSLTSTTKSTSNSKNKQRGGGSQSQQATA